MNQSARSLMSAAVLGAAVCLTTSADAGLVGLWQFEGNFLDSSDFGNDGTGQNGVGFGAGQAGFGQAGSFGGTSRVLVPHDASLDMTSVMTIAAWVNAVGSSWEGVLAKNPSNGSPANHAGNYELRLESGSEDIQFLYQRGGFADTATIDSGSPVPVNSWQHVAVTIDGTGGSETIKFYLNGSLVNTVSGANGFGATNTNPLLLGSRADNGTPFHGFLDDIAIFNEVLDVNQINTIKDGDFSAFVIPEPASGAMAAIGLGIMIGSRRRG